MKFSNFRAKLATESALSDSMSFKPGDRVRIKGGHQHATVLTKPNKKGNHTVQYDADDSKSDVHPRHLSRVFEENSTVSEAVSKYVSGLFAKHASGSDEPSETQTSRNAHHAAANWHGSEAMKALKSGPLRNKTQVDLNNKLLNYHLNKRKRHLAAVDSIKEDISIEENTIF